MDFSFVENYIIYILAAVIIGFIINICIAAKFASIAKDKGYSFAAHFILCLLFGFIGWIAVCSLPDKRSRKALEKIAKVLVSGSKPAEPDNIVYNNQYQQ